jgi:hypothetical protein
MLKNSYRRKELLIGKIHGLSRQVSPASLLGISASPDSFGE